MAIAPDRNEVNDWLARAGIVREGDEVTRVLIDIDKNCAVKVYVQKCAEERLLTAEPLDMGACVVKPEPREEDS